MRLLTCAGGTGGGVYPALTVLQALGSDAQPALWVGSEGGMEASLIARAGVPFAAISAAGVHGVGLRVLPGNLWSLLKGTLAAGRILRQFKPDVLLFTGGFVAAPMAVAGMGRPMVLFVPDIEPGLALKFLARFARKIALVNEASRRYFKNPERLVVTGYPVRPDVAKWTRSAAREHFGVAESEQVIVVVGGSKGARSINRAVLANLPALLEMAVVIHISGELDWPEVSTAAQQLNAEQQARYHAFAYLHEDMGAALAAADIAVCRAGASTLGELPHFSLPAILVPYPHAWRYQKVNADVLTRQGAAELLQDDRLGSELLLKLRGLLDQPEQLKKMGRAMHLMAHPDAANKIADLVRELADTAGHQVKD